MRVSSRSQIIYIVEVSPLIMFSFVIYFPDRGYQSIAAAITLCTCGRGSIITSTVGIVIPKYQSSIEPPTVSRGHSRPLGRERMSLFISSGPGFLPVVPELN